MDIVIVVVVLGWRRVGVVDVGWIVVWLGVYGL